MISLQQIQARVLAIREANVKREDRISITIMLNNLVRDILGSIEASQEPTAKPVRGDDGDEELKALIREVLDGYTWIYVKKE